MIFQFLDLINNPAEWALTWTGKEFRAEPLADLRARGARIRTLPLDGSAWKSSGSPTASDNGSAASDN